MGEGKAVAQQIESLCHASLSLASPACAQLFGLIESWKRVLPAYVVDTVEARSTLPILVQYSSDCTLSRVRQYYKKAAGGKSLKRSSQGAVEFLVHHLLVSSYNSSGALEHVIIPGEPIGLTHGKTMTCLAACWVQFPLMAAFQSEYGRIRVRFQVYDRGVSQGLVSAISGYWMSKCLASSTEDDFVAMSAELFEWHVASSCAIHDATNALKWGHFLSFGDTELVQNIYIGITSYKFCLGFAVDLLSTWLPMVLKPVSRSLLPSAQVLSEMWTLVGVSPELVPVLVEEIGVHWDGSSLKVDETFMSKSDWLDILSVTLLGVWDLSVFTTSLWLSVGPSSRAMTAGLLSGLFSLVACVRESGCASDYYASGVSKIQSRELEFLAVVGVSSYMPEAVQRRLLDDARVPRQVQELTAELALEFSYTENVSQEVWELILA